MIDWLTNTDGPFIRRNSMSILRCSFDCEQFLPGSFYTSLFTLYFILQVIVVLFFVFPWPFTVVSRGFQGYWRISRYFSMHFLHILQFQGAVEGYFAHNIKTSDIVLNEREGNFEENGWFWLTLAWCFSTISSWPTEIFHGEPPGGP